MLITAGILYCTIDGDISHAEYVVFPSCRAVALRSSLLVEVSVPATASLLARPGGPSATSRPHRHSQQDCHRAAFPRKTDAAGVEEYLPGPLLATSEPWLT